MRNRVSALAVFGLIVTGMVLGTCNGEAVPLRGEWTGGAPCSPTAKACLQLSTNQAWLMNSGVVTYGPVPVTTGRPGYETPPGTYHVTFKDKNFYSTAFNGPMPYSVFFNGGIAFHEGSLRVLSHGCVHLSHAAAVEFFNTLAPHDEVQVVN